MNILAGTRRPREHSGARRRRTGPGTRRACVHGGRVQICSRARAPWVVGPQHIGFSHKLPTRSAWLPLRGTPLLLKKKKGEHTVQPEMSLEGCMLLGGATLNLVTTQCLKGLIQEVMGGQQKY